MDYKALLWFMAGGVVMLAIVNFQTLPEVERRSFKEGYESHDQKISNAQYQLGRCHAAEDYAPEQTKRECKP